MNTGLLVVDVQPEYDAFCRHIAKRVATRINGTSKPVTVMWVGQGISADTEQSVREYLLEHGARGSRLDRACFIEKDYGFLRDWMDEGVPQDLIVKAGEAMIQNNVRSTEDLDLEVIFDNQLEAIPDWGRLTLPSFDTKPLECFDHLDTCGGGDEECLAEIELWLKMTNKRIRRLHSLVY